MLATCQHGLSAEVEGTISVVAKQLVACIGTVAGGVPSMPDIANQVNYLVIFFTVKLLFAN